ANLLDHFAMKDSVPGVDAVLLAPPAEGIPDAAHIERYSGALSRLATPYAVDSKGRASTSQYEATTLSPAGGLVSTVRDLAEFDLGLRQGLLLNPETLAAAWRAPIGRDGYPLPHG